MIQRNRFDCRYVDSFIRLIGSTGSPRGRTVFTTGTNTKRWEVPTLSKNTYINILQEGSAWFKATLSLNKEKCIKAMSPFT